MSRIFPIKRPVEHAPDGSKLVGLTDETADEVFATLSSATARTILEALYDEPRTPSDLKEVTGTTLQNVHYHLTNMENAGLIEVVDTWYSEKGASMNVYAPCARAVLVMASSRDDRSLLRDLLARVFAVVLLLGLVSVALGQYLDSLVQTAAVRSAAPESAVGFAASDSGQAAATGATTVPPELVFFAGGLLALVLFVAVTRVRSSLR
ncbi:ArsR/SmtB family transcription factor [Haloarchaeobius sp. DFWS5]|uniref:ArsR/SmtB family transcription factor n=1 Tax=Haloarchaeobius sp. DFWS5 TaxID=3446114 RepID=UPI003EBFFEF9